jgi:hypothetical protein
MAMTIAQQAMIERNPLRKGVLMGLLEQSYIMQKLPFENLGALSTQVVRWKTLPNSVAFRDLNEEFAEGTGDMEQLQEAVYDLGTDIDVDLLLTKDGNAIVDPRALQTKMQLKSISYFWNDQFINGDRAVTPKGFDGIKVRHANLVVDDAELEIDAAGLDMSEAGRVTADVHKFLDYLDRLLYRVDGGKADMLLMNDRGLLAFESAFRRAGLLDQTKDMFDRHITTFKGIPLVDLGVKADQTTKIIPNNFDATDRTSIFAVKFGVGEYLHGIQQFAMDTRDIGELEDKPVLRTRIQWPCGLANWHRRSIARLRNVKFT